VTATVIIVSAGGGSARDGSASGDSDDSRGKVDSGVDVDGRDRGTEMIVVTVL
jgi:hypothetical protein